MKHQIEPQVQMFYQYAATVVVCIPLYFVFGDGKFEEEFPQSLSYLTVGWTMPSPELLALLFLMTAANLLLQYSYIYANTLKSSPAQIQNIQYLALPALVGLELLLFNDVPDQYVLLGVVFDFGYGLSAYKMVSQIVSQTFFAISYGLADGEYYP